MGKTTIIDIADDLVEKTYKILNWRFLAATGIEIGATKTPKGLPKNYEHFDQDILQEIVDAVKPMLKEFQAAKRIEVQNAHEILKLIGKGLISINEALNLMRLMQMKNETEKTALQLELQKKAIDILNEEEGENEKNS